MRVATKACDDVVMSHRRGVDSVIGVLFEEWQTCFLDRDIFAVHHRDQHEMSPALLRVVEVPAAPTEVADSEGLAIACKSARCVAVDVAGKLIQDQYQRQAALAIAHPWIEVAVESLLDKDAKTLAHCLVKAGVFSEPLYGPAYLEPKCQDFIGETWMGHAVAHD